MELMSGGDALDWLFVAMARERLGEHDAAVVWYQKAVDWSQGHPDEARLSARFRDEAEALLHLDTKTPK